MITHSAPSAHFSSFTARISPGKAINPVEGDISDVLGVRGSVQLSLIAVQLILQAFPSK